MSITVRLWSKEELESLQEDKKLATVFMNGKSFGEEEIKYYPYNLRHTYVAYWWQESEEGIVFYATDDEMAKWFLEQEYTTMPDDLEEKMTTFRSITL